MLSPNLFNSSFSPKGACPASDGLESVHDRYLIVIVVCWYFFVESFHSFLCRVACPEPLTCSALPFSESSVPYFSSSRQKMSYKQIYILAIRERALAKIGASLIVCAAPARASPELNTSLEIPMMALKCHSPSAPI